MAIHLENRVKNDLDKDLKKLHQGSKELHTLLVQNAHANSETTKLTNVVCKLKEDMEELCRKVTDASNALRGQLEEAKTHQEASNKCAERIHQQQLDSELSILQVKLSALEEIKQRTIGERAALETIIKTLIVPHLIQPVQPVQHPVQQDKIPQPYVSGWWNLLSTVCPSFSSPFSGILGGLNLFRLVPTRIMKWVLLPSVFTIIIAVFQNLSWCLPIGIGLIGLWWYASIIQSFCKACVTQALDVCNTYCFRPIYKFGMAVGNIIATVGAFLKAVLNGILAIPGSVMAFSQKAASRIYTGATRASELLKSAMYRSLTIGMRVLPYAVITVVIAVVGYLLYTHLGHNQMNTVSGPPLYVVDYYTEREMSCADCVNQGQCHWSWDTDLPPSESATSRTDTAMATKSTTILEYVSKGFLTYFALYVVSSPSTVTPTFA